MGSIVTIKKPLEIKKFRIIQMFVVHMLNYFEEITKPIYSGLELALRTKKYRKLVVKPDYGMSYGVGVFYCSSKFITCT